MIAALLVGFVLHTSIMCAEVLTQVFVLGNCGYGLKKYTESLLFTAAAATAVAAAAAVDSSSSREEACRKYFFVCFAVRSLQK